MSSPSSEREESLVITPERVLFENEDYLAIDKGRGWLVHETLDPNRANLFTALRAWMAERDGDESDPYVALHHRLDRWTSGVIVFAISRRANPVLANVFSERVGTKTYRAVCVGRPAEDSGELRHHLAKERIDKIDRMVPVQRGGKVALSRYRLIAADHSTNRSLVEFELVTGRMHQLRVQTALEGFPILGDDLYGDSVANTGSGLGGQLLHARSLSFDDPLSDSTIELSAPEPSLFSSFAPDRSPR